MSRRPSFQSELSYDSGSLADLSAASTSRLPNRPESGRTANSQQQQTWPNSISSVLAQPSSSSNFFLSPSSTLQNLNPLRPAAQAGSRNAASRGKPAATVQLSVLPEVQKSEFETYLSEIQDEYAVWAKQKRPTTASIVKSPSSNSITDLSSFHRHQLLPDLEVVPTLFMSEDFDLTLPRTFEAVTQLNPTITATVPDTSEAASRKPPSASPSFSHMALGDIASDQMLQEKLSHYLDVVEQHLALEIASRSSTFFSALSNLQALDSQSEAALKQAAQLKSQLALVARWSQAGLQGLRMALRRHRLQKIQEGAVKIKEVVKALGQASDLATEGEWEGALGLVEEVQTAYHSDNSGQKQQDLRLDRLKALSGVPSKLVTLKKTIATSLQAELLNVLTHQLHAHTHTYVKQSQQLGKDFKWEASNLKEVASEATRSLIRGLVRCGPGLRAVEDGVATWRESVLSTIQGIIQKHLPSATSLDESSNAKASNDLLRMSHADFLGICRAVYRELQGALSILQALTEIILAISEDSLPNSPTTPTEQPASESSTLSEDLQDLVYAAADAANGRFSRVMSARADIHTSLSLDEFIVLFKESWAFALTCEIMCKRMIVGLRGTLVSQSKAFLSSFHRKSVETSARLIENEHWAPAEVPSQIQHTVNLMVEGAVADPKALIVDTDSANTSREAEKVATSGLTKTLDIEGRDYHAVSACLRCLETLQDYLKIVINITLLTTETMGRIVEFLKQFNSRTCQLVLGAGALRSAGLKNITAKHLALASQTISVLIALIPYIRELVRRHLSPRQAVMLVDFDKLKQDLQDHLNEINDKLVSIMGDRLAIHCKTLQSLDWSAQPDSDTPPKPSGYMEALIKETTTLHKVLSRFMPGQALEFVMMQVLSTITSRLAEEYSKMELPDNKAKSKLAADAKYLKERLGDLKGLERTIPGKELEVLVQNLTTKEQPTLPPKDSPPPLSPRTESAQNSPSLQQVPLSPPNTDRVSSPPIASPNVNMQSSNVRNRLGALFRTNTLRRSISSDSQPMTSPTIQQGSPDQEKEVGKPSSAAEQPAATEHKASIDLQEADEDAMPVPSPSLFAQDSGQSSSLMTEALASPIQDVTPAEREDVPARTSRGVETLQVPEIVQPSGSTDDLALLGGSTLTEEPKEALTRPDNTAALAGDVDTSQNRTQAPHAEEPSEEALARPDNTAALAGDVDTSQNRTQAPHAEEPSEEVNSAASLEESEQTTKGTDDDVHSTSNEVAPST